MDADRQFRTGFVRENVMGFDQGHHESHMAKYPIAES